MNIASNPDEYCEVCQEEDHEVCSINIEVKGLLPNVVDNSCHCCQDTLRQTLENYNRWK